MQRDAGAMRADLRGLAGRSEALRRLRSKMREWAILPEWAMQLALDQGGLSAPLHPRTSVTLDPVLKSARCALFKQDQPRQQK